MALNATIAHMRKRLRYRRTFRALRRLEAIRSCWGMCDTCNAWNYLVSGCWTCLSCHRADCA